MAAYSLFDAIEERRHTEEAIKMLREEEEAELSEWLAQSIKPRIIQDAVSAAVGSKADAAAINNAFDDCDIEETISEFIQTLADEIAHQQMNINDKFK